ncbi:MAG: hypothetical protein WCJ03_05865 [Bacteroidales bacterium]
MKRITIFLFILTLFSCKKEVQKEFLFSNISHLNEKEVYLWIGAGTNCRVDTIKVRNGLFVVNTAPEDAEAMMLFFPKCNQMISFFGNSDSRLKISGNLSSPESLVVEGDSVNNSITHYKRSILPEVKALNLANAKADKAWQKDSIKRYEELLFAPISRQIKEKFEAKTTAFISKNQSSYQAIFAAREYFSLTNDIQPLQNWWHLLKGDNVKEFSAFQELKKIYKQQLPLTVGHNLLAFQTYTTDNRQEYFYVQSGKKMLVLFWSSADKYSTYLNKKLSAASFQLAKDTITYTAISLDDSFEEWKSAVKDLKTKQLIARGGFQNESIRQLGIGQTPLLLQIGKNTKITKVYAIGENPLK